MKTALMLVLGLGFAPRAQAQEEDPERVVMRLEDFLRLYEASRDREKDPPKPPHAWASAAAHYDGRVVFEDGEPVSAVFDATFRIEVLETESWVKVPLLPTTVALTSTRMGNGEAPIAVENGWFFLVTDEPGVHEVRVSFATSVFSAEGASGFSFQLSPSGATTLRLAVPAEEELEFTVAEARVQEERIERGQRVVEASIPGTGSLAVAWQREIPEAAEPDEPRVYAEVYTLVGIGDGLVRATSTLQHTILFAGVDQIEVGIPEGMTLLDVDGAGIRDWSVAGGTLTVALNFEAEGSYPLMLELEKVIGEGDVVTEAPVPVPIGVERAKGWVGVEALGNLEISGLEAENAAMVDVRTLPAAILGITTQPVLLGYKYLGPDPVIPLQVAQHDDVDVLVTLLDQARATTLWTVDGRRMTRVTWQVRNNRKQYLRVALPEGAELWSASLGGRAVQPAQAADGRVLLPLVRSQSQGGSLAAFHVEVVYVEQGEPPTESGRGTFSARLPTADVPTTYVAWQVFLPDDVRIPRRTIASNLRHVEAFSNPIPSHDVRTIPAHTQEVQQGAADQAAGGALGDGAVPVPVSLPTSGDAVYFEKLLALDEPLEVTFAYRGLDLN